MALTTWAGMRGALIGGSGLVFHAAGMTFLGQFLDHDLTFDPTSSLERQVDPEAISNFRTPALELDSVYGSGPGATPHLYDQQPADPFDRGIKLLTEAIDGCEAVSRGGVTRHDLPRNRQGVALTGDPRNDENLIVSQLHLVFLRFHNAAVDHVRAELGAARVVRDHAAQAREQRRRRLRLVGVEAHRPPHRPYP